jgi:hypothetical protein
MPAASMVHASLLSDTQDMYWRRYQKWPRFATRQSGTYCVVESRLVLKPIHRKTPGASFVAILIGFCYDRGSLLRVATNEGIERRKSWVGDIHVVWCILPDVLVIEWLNENE